MQPNIMQAIQPESEAPEIATSESMDTAPKSVSPTILGKREPASQPSTLNADKDDLTDAMQFARLTYDLREGVRNPILKKARDLRKKTTRNLHQKLRTLKEKTDELTGSVLRHPSFNPSIKTIPKESLEKLKVIENLEVLISSHEAAQTRAGQVLDNQVPKAQELREQAFQIIEMLKQKKPAALDASDHSKREALHGQELDMALQFYHTTIKQMAMGLKLQPVVCLKCWSILFSNSHVIADAKTHVRLKVPCSEIFWDQSLGLKKVGANLSTWRKCSKELLRNSNHLTEQKADNFPNIILPEEQISHNCWDGDKGAVLKDFKEWHKTIAQTHSGEKTLEILKGLNSLEQIVGSANLSDRPPSTSNRIFVQSVPHSPAQPPQSDSKVRNPTLKKKRQSTDVPAPPASFAPPAPSGPPIPATKKRLIHAPNHDGQTSAGTLDASKVASALQGLLRKAPLKSSLRSRSAETLSSKQDNQPSLTIDLKTDPAGWKWISYIENGTTITKSISQLEKAWLAK
jgi:hypothetical protein